MADKEQEIEIRSDEVQEIMSHVPNWMIRWGITLIFSIIVLGLMVSWLIRYPDVISGTVELTTVSPPVKLVSKNAGEIEHIYIQNNNKVNKGDIIISLKNTMNDSAKLELEELCVAIRSHLTHDKISAYNLKKTNHTFGIVHAEYSNLIKSINDYQALVNDGNTSFKIQNIQEQIKNNKRLEAATIKQKVTAKKQFTSATEKFEADQKLYKQGVTSKMKFYEDEKMYINAQKELENFEKSLIQHAITITDLKRQLNELEFSYNKDKKGLQQAIEYNVSFIENALKNWRLNYQISAQTNGTLSYIETLNENKFIEAGKTLFAIIPDNQEYLGYVKVPKTGYGKIKKGQMVRIKLDNFPHHEYGQINGTVEDISLISSEDQYLIKIHLSNGLISSYNKSIEFTPEMSGTAEIITENLRLTDRIFNSIRKIFDN